MRADNRMPVHHTHTHTAVNTVMATVTCDILFIRRVGRAAMRSSNEGRGLFARCHQVGSSNAVTVVIVVAVVVVVVVMMMTLLVGRLVGWFVYSCYFVVALSSSLPCHVSEKNAIKKFFRLVLYSSDP